MTGIMGTMLECLHRTLEDKNVGSANTDIGAEFRSVGLEPGALNRQWFNGYHISEKKLKSMMLMSLCYTPD